jgi:hypothetical protein
MKLLLRAKEVRFISLCSPSILVMALLLSHKATKLWYSEMVYGTIWVNPLY